MAGKTKKVKRGRPRKEKNWTAQNLQESADYYFNKCDSRTRDIPTKKGLVTIDFPAPYTIEGLCLHLGVSTVTFREWRKREDSLGDKARMLHQRIADNRITGGLDGTQNSSFAQFMLKNNNAEDYKEKVEVENSVSGALASIFDTLSGAVNKPGGGNV